MAGFTTKVPVMMQNITTPAFSGQGAQEDGLSFGQLGNEILIAITHRGEALYVRLQGDAIDLVAHKFADCIEHATRHEFPTMGGAQ